jgi:putative drug exporter of the RND superfamily
LIMIFVFGAFVANYSPEVKMFGLGLAFAVLVDATIVRMMLVPSIMEILGDANWWFPKWLSFLPRIDIEGDAPKPAPEVEAVPEPVTSGV